MSTNVHRIGSMKRLHYDPGSSYKHGRLNMFETS